MRPAAASNPGHISAAPSIAVIIPCYQVEGSVSRVLNGIGSDVSFIFCVDDASHDGTAAEIEKAAQRDPRVTLVKRQTNGGVGAATLDGYTAALVTGASVLVKMDGDGQMDASLIRFLAEPVLNGSADYVKGNRFYSLESVRGMPAVRMWGNAALSFLTKLSTGYWNLFDPNNGFTAIHAEVAAALPFAKIHRRYFFEADMLFRLNTLRARIIELPMRAVYQDEVSHLSIPSTFLRFPLLHFRNLLKRIFYNHFLRNFSVASLNLVAGLMLILGGTCFGIVKWIQSYQSGIPATAGTVMLSGLPVLVGIHLVLSFLAYDISLVPDRVIHRYLRGSSLTPRSPDGS